jgi:hypothetical protein
MASFCAGCGNSIAADDRFCRVCGRQPAAGSAVTAPLTAPSVAGATSGKAMVSLICGMLFFVPFLFVAAIVFGHLALSEIGKSAGGLKGQGIAMTGLVLGYLWIAGIPILLMTAAIAIPNILRARMAANESSAIASRRTLDAAEIIYTKFHPGQGYACSLSDLAEAQSIAKPLATGQKNGYVFELTRCAAETEGRANAQYQVVAYPLRVNRIGCAPSARTSPA